MRGIAIVFLAFLAYSSAYPLEEQQVSVLVPESSLQVEASEKDAVVPDASEIVQIVAVPVAEAVQSKAQQLLDVDAGVSASIEGARQARQFGYGGFGGFPGGGYGGFPGGGYGGYGGHRHGHRGGFFG
ncbi:uncharacterized protein LOC126751501 isoform X2 [Bactrocera neohumeralis]|uniref:uncharacterized protein LOC126751501 isoform X2 n=1 Tax=Bactrocera neohumeralis TaxID=98809 RepID=UPI002165F65C|nr:uncharacterized protein LOC126751501 isoform X2 [Bactrocera neohumeralis]